MIPVDQQERQQPFTPTHGGGVGWADPPPQARPATQAKPNGSAPRHAFTPASSPALLEMLRAVDMIAALGALAIVFLLANTDEMPRGFQDFLVQRVSLKNLLAGATFLICWQQIFAFFGLYDTARRPNRSNETRRVIAASSVASLMLLAIPLVSTNEWFHPAHAAIVWSFATAGALFARRALRLGVRSTQRRDARHVIIVGSGARALRLYEDLCAHPESRYKLVGFVDTNPQAASDVVRTRMLGSVDELERILMEHLVDEVLVALPMKSCYAEIQQSITVCERAGIQASCLADVFQTSVATPFYEESHNTPVVAMKVAADDYRLAIKRGIDILGATMGIVLFAPLMLIIAIAIKLTSPGPVIYAQARHGLRRRQFRMLKFRTMVSNADLLQAALEGRNEASGPVFKISNDPRITRVGRLLRRSSLDELPQLFNILKGDMSLVGPRPLPTRDVSHFDESWLIRRFSVPAGLTGLWQISGRSSLGFEDWMALDLQYIDQWSLALDVQILMRTIPAVLTGRGAS